MKQSRKRKRLKKMAVNNSLVKSKSDSNPLEITFKAGNADVKLSPNTVKKYLVSGDADKVTTQEIVMFINLCKYQGLNQDITRSLPD